MPQQSTRLIPVTQANPCEICQATKKCSRKEDGLRMCRGKKGRHVPGWKWVGFTEEAGWWDMYRAADDPLLYENQGAAPPPKPERAEKKAKKIDSGPLLLRAQKYRGALSHDRKEELARELQLPLHALDVLPLLGWHARDHNGGCWTFPEFDGEGNLVNLLRRWPGRKDKWISPDCTAGLCLPEKWGQLEGPLYLCEGASDTLALRCIGLDAVGRPNNTSGVPYLSQLLQDFPSDREILVMGEMDPKRKKGEWPGLEGAVKCSTQLAAALSRRVQIAMPPAGKDCREWFVLQNLAAADSDTLSTAGVAFQEALDPWDETPQKEDDGAELQTSTLEHVEEKVVRWLVPNYFPKGYLALLCGDGKMGKGFITLHVAAQLSRGEPCFGLDYSTYDPVESLFAAREDGRGDMLLPRVQALGGIIPRIHFVDDVKYPEGKVKPFSLAEMQALEKKLIKNPRIKFIVIDPIDSYISATGVDDFKAASVRDNICDPLNALAMQLHVCILMVLHVNKGTGPKAVDRISGSKAYFTGVRVAYMCFPEPGTESIRGFTNPALQMSTTNPSLKYKIGLTSTTQQEKVLRGLAGKMDAADMESYRQQLACVEWLGESGLEPDDYCALDSLPPENDQFEKQEASNWLRKHLANGALPGKSCVEDGNAALQINGAMKWWRDVILKRKLGGNTVKGGFTEGWLWHLPGQAIKTPEFPEEA